MEKITTADVLIAIFWAVSFIVALKYFGNAKRH